MEKELMSQHLEINRIENELQSVLPNLAKRFDMSEITLWVLYMVTISPVAMTQSELCAKWNFSRQTVNTILGKMEKNGLVRLDFQEGNRKNKLIYLTDSGKALADRLVPAMLEAQEEALLELTFSERMEYIRLLRKYTDASKKAFSRIQP